MSQLHDKINPAIQEFANVQSNCTDMLEKELRAHNQLPVDSKRFLVDVGEDKVLSDQLMLSRFISSPLLQELLKAVNIHPHQVHSV